MKRHFILFWSPSQTPQITWSLIEQSFYHCSLGLINFNDYIAKNIIRYMYICIFIFWIPCIHSFIILQYLRLHFSMFFLSKVDILVCSALRNAGTLVWCKVFFYVFHKRNVLKNCFKCILWLHYMYKYMALIKLIL